MKIVVLAAGVLVRVVRQELCDKRLFNEFRSGDLLDADNSYVLKPHLYSNYIWSVKMDVVVLAS
jgi:hypothetical protein